MINDSGLGLLSNYNRYYLMTRNHSAFDFPRGYKQCQGHLPAE